jgi:hypothetical protein
MSNAGGGNADIAGTADIAVTGGIGNAENAVNDVN